MRAIAITFVVCLVGLQIKAQDLEADGDLYAEASEYAPQVYAVPEYSAPSYGQSSYGGSGGGYGGRLKMKYQIFIKLCYSRGYRLVKFLYQTKSWKVNWKYFSDIFSALKKCCLKIDNLFYLKIIGYGGGASYGKGQSYGSAGYGSGSSGYGGEQKILLSTLKHQE